MMIVGQRIAERLKVIDMTQSELARRVGINQSTINALIRGLTRSSVHLHKIARALGTTPAYLNGETDDPHEGAPPPQPPAPIQVALPVTLPPVEALERAYLGLLMASRHMNEAELAHELAVRLPRLLSVVQGPLRVGAEPLEPADTQADDHRERRRA